MFKIRFSKTFLNEIIGTVTYLKYVITKIKKVVLFFKFAYVLMFKPCNFTKGLSLILQVDVILQVLFNNYIGFCSRVIPN